MNAVSLPQFTQLLLKVLCIFNLGIGWALAGIRLEPINRDIPAPLAQSQYRALVIGNNTYTDNKGRGAEPRGFIASKVPENEPGDGERGNPNAMPALTLPG